MMDSSNPISIKYYCAKLEFQGRGAPHNHGTLWVDMDKMEFMMERAPKSSKSRIDYNLLYFESLFGDSE